MRDAGTAKVAVRVDAPLSNPEPGSGAPVPNPPIGAEIDGVGVGGDV